MRRIHRLEARLLPGKRPRIGRRLACGAGKCRIHTRAALYSTHCRLHLPAPMMLPILRIGLTLLLVTASAFAQPNDVRKSLARISNTAQEANYRIPWLPGQTGGGTGTGWVVSPDRILTNAH